MRKLRIGIVCPYSFDVPGGVQAHIRDLAEALIDLGHDVSVLTPADNDDVLPHYVVSAGKALSVPYNGSVARVAFGPISAARVRRWLKNGRFDVLHVHEPTIASLSLLACLAARGPIVATFHTAMTRSRLLWAAHGALQPMMEKVSGRIAVSALARRVQVEHMSGGAVEIPNGVTVSKFANAEPLPGWPGEDGVIGFLGRFTEPRKGFDILLDAFEQVVAKRPSTRLLVAGPGDADVALKSVPKVVRDRITMLGMVSDEEKARMLRSVDVYAAPNTGGESFGIILTEAMAAGAAVVASDLDAFRRVLDDGRAGAMFENRDSTALADVLLELLDDPGRRASLARRAREVVAEFDWLVVAARVLEVYSAVLASTDETVTGDDDMAPPADALPPALRNRFSAVWRR